MKLFLFECKKMICSPNILLLILLLLITNFGKITISLHNNPMLLGSLTKRTDTVYQTYESKYEGKITEKKAKEIVEGYQSQLNFMLGTNEYNEAADYCYRIYALYKYQYTYHMMIQETLDEASQNVIFFQDRNNPYQVELNKLIQKIYSGRQIEKYYNSEDFSFLFEYQFSTLLLLLYALVLSYHFFYTEKENGTYQMLISLGKKRQKVFVAKYLNLFCGLFFTGIILYIQDYILYGKMLYLRGCLNPVYAIQSYSNTPFNVSILGYYFLICAMRVGIIFLISLIFVFVEQLLSGRIIPVVASGLIAVCVILTGDAYLNVGVYGKKLHVISILNHVFPAHFVWLAVYAVLLLIFSTLVYRTFKTQV